jgi:RP/EB family microtubule-associated protein
MQDNLDFLQFSKRYWDQHYPGGEYDAVGRRKGGGPPPAAAPRAAASTNARRPVGGSTGGLGARARTPQGGAASAALQQENAVLKETVTGLERERDFYFSKLRDIELMIQQAFEENPDVEKDENNILKQIQAILYSTEVRIHQIDQYSIAYKLSRKDLRFQMESRKKL